MGKSKNQSSYKTVLFKRKSSQSGMFTFEQKGSMII